jgi:hypothetical protein
MNSFSETVDMYVPFEIVVRTGGWLKRYYVYYGILGGRDQRIVACMGADIIKTGTMPDERFKNGRVLHGIGSIPEYDLGCVIGLICAELETGILQADSKNSGRGDPYGVREKWREDLVKIS